MVHGCEGVKGIGFWRCMGVRCKGYWFLTVRGREALVEDTCPSQGEWRDRKKGKPEDKENKSVKAQEKPTAHKL